MIKLPFSIKLIPSVICSFFISVQIVHANTSDSLTGKLAIVNKASAQLTVLNLKDQTKQTFKLGTYLPHETAVAQNLIFVSNYGSAYIRSSSLMDVPGNTLSVIDLYQPTKDPQIIDLGPGRCGPHGLTVSPDQKRLYITCEVRQEILMMDVATQKIIKSLPTNQAGSHLMVLDSKETRAFVGNFFHGTISMINLNTQKIIAQIPVDKGTEGIGISPDDKYIFATSPLSNNLIKIDIATQKEIGRKFLGENCGSLRVVPTPDTGKQLVINCSDNNTVKIVNAETLDIEKEIKVERLPIGIAVANSTYAYSANMEDNTVSIINLRSRTLEANVPAGDVPDGMYYFN